ncbi:hypothetical protein F2Q68_00012412 [Brassica cretica]|uniref:Uncharacterized protein n=1 Tax=Brassica cretica TaxID=69181 RepID=A0A8S9L525_BRACR|nr:hypothetical protein F2Q68_00012412 [Brassica cretica]
MASLFNKFQQVNELSWLLCLILSNYLNIVSISCTIYSNGLLEFLPRVPHLLRTQRQLQFEADINKLFMYTSYGDGAEEIIEMAGKTSLSEQQRQVQENIHHIVENFCSLMDGILLPDVSKNESGSQTASPPPPRQSGLLSPLVGVILFQLQMSSRYIPGYPKVDSHTSYLITRYDGTVINSQPWGLGGEAKELWTGTSYTPAVKQTPKYQKTVQTGGSNGLDAPVLKTLVLVATRELCDEELLLNYRLTNSKRRPDCHELCFRAPSSVSELPPLFRTNTTS